MGAIDEEAERQAAERDRREGLAVGGGARDVGQVISEAAAESLPADVPMDGEADLCRPNQGGGGQR